MSTVVVGTLYVHCPDALAAELRPQVEMLRSPGVWCSEFSSEWNTVFALSEVPYPVEQTRYMLAGWYRSYAQRAQLVYWSWVPPAGAVVLPGGTVGLVCREEATVLVQEELRRWYPGAMVYTFPSEDGWQLSQVDAPPPGEDIYGWYVVLSRQVPSLSLHWQRWFDHVMLPDGSLESVLHPGV